MTPALSNLRRLAEAVPERPRTSRFNSSNETERADAYMAMTDYERASAEFYSHSTDVLYEISCRRSLSIDEVQKDMREFAEANRIIASVRAREGE